MYNIKGGSYMKEKTKFLIYRIYSKKEMSSDNNKYRAVLYGWTENKAVLKGFLEQRNPKKYRSIKITSEDIEEKFSENTLDSENRIDILKLKSVTSKNDISFFTTLKEMREAEIKIQQYFHDLSSLSDIEGNYNYLDLFCNINDYYKVALEFLGFRPQELDIIFPSASEYDSYSNIFKTEEQIESCYDEFVVYDDTDTKVFNKLPGLSAIDDVANKILYSLESFVKILVDDL